MKKEQSIISIRSTNYGSNFWLTKSLKTNKETTLFSNLEYYNLLTVEFDPKIIKFEIQPELAGVKMDMKVYFTDGRTEYWEIKYFTDVFGDNKSEKTTTQINSQEEVCKQTGMIHRIITEKDIIKGPAHINNLKYMYQKLKFRDNINLTQLRNVILPRIRKASIINIINLVDETISLDEALVCVFDLLYKGEVYIDYFDEEISVFSEVYVK